MTQELRTNTLSKQADETEMHSSLYDRLHLKMISLIHDTLYSVFVDPYRWLSEAGVAQGLTVVEVGCGPGFFTSPAAELIGKHGHLHTFDINPAAVNQVRKKVEDRHLVNVDVRHRDAADTGLPDASIDVAFLFGVLRSIKDLDPVLREMHRVLKSTGVLAVERSSSSEENLLDRITKDACFRYTFKDGRIYRFAKESLADTSSTVSPASLKSAKEVR